MQIHYFQRYHTKENVDTSNTLLMLSRLYTYSPAKFFDFLKNTILPDSIEPELTFNLQERAVGSIPDAVISQPSFKVVVETKLNNGFILNQLKNHLESFSNEDTKVILTLDPRPMSNNMMKEFEKYLEEYNEKLKVPIYHCNTTFKELINGMQSVIDVRDTEIIDILDDFEEYCMDQKLIPDDDKLMRAITAGTTLEDNFELNLYYDSAERNFSSHAYIGLYSKKCIQAVAKIRKIVVAHVEHNEIKIKVEQGQSITDQETKSIKEAIERSRKYGYDLTVPHRYFLVDKFYKTDYKKITPYPIQRTKYFDLKDLLQCTELPSDEEIAEQLSKLTW